MGVGTKTKEFWCAVHCKVTKDVKHMLNISKVQKKEF